MLKVRGLARTGPQGRLLGPVDLDLAPGECVAVMGPSGSGKSLLLRAIADLDPSEGTVTLDGVDRNSMPAPAWRRRVGYLAAESGWWADRVGAHFPDVAKAKGVLDRLGLSASALDWTVARLSTGERQRLALARLLLVEPAVMLLDEPTSALDAESVAKVEALLEAQRIAGAAILIATHDKAQARRLAGWRLIMEGGQAQEMAA